jgi:hypothetical protein
MILAQHKYQELLLHMDPSRLIVLSIVLVSIVSDMSYLIIIPQFVTNLPYHKLVVAL